MSANNLLRIRKEGSTYTAYDCSVDYDGDVIYPAAFVANSLEEAVKSAESYCKDNLVEFGYTFENL